MIKSIYWFCAYSFLINDFNSVSNINHRDLKIQNEHLISVLKTKSINSYTCSTFIPNNCDATFSAEALEYINVASYGPKWRTVMPEIGNMLAEWWLTVELCDHATLNTSFSFLFRPTEWSYQAKQALRLCNILTSDPAVDQGTGASGRRYQGITLTVNGLNWMRCDAHRKQVDIKQLYNPVRQELQSVWRQFLQFEVVRTRPSGKPGPQGPRSSSPAERERSAAKDEGTGGKYVAVFVQSPNHLSHKTLLQPFRIKWEVYFSKEPCSFDIIVLTIFLHVYVYSCIRITAMQQLSPDYILQIIFILNKSSSSSSSSRRPISRDHPDVLPPIFLSSIASGWSSRLHSVLALICCM